MVRHSVFAPDPWGDGGARRTAQVGELLERLPCKAPLLKAPTDIGWFAALTVLAREAGLLRRSGLPLRLSRDVVWTLGQNLRSYREQLSALPKGSVLFWEGTQSRFAHLPLLARDLGVRVVGLPHNLESLVPESCSFWSGQTAPHWFAEELHSLAACDLVFTIAREDQWLLRLHGIPAGYLPYHPSKAVEGFLAEIRVARYAKPPSNDLLLLGTAANAPTFAGMVDRLRFFNENRRLFGRLHVVGYGTERLREVAVDYSNIHLHGTIDHNALCRLLVTVRAAVIHQQPTSGALTRIPELLLAGVPVLANTDAARSAFRMSGVHVYEGDAQLAELLEVELPVGESPVRPTTFERQFLEQVHLLLGGDS